MKTDDDADDDEDEDKAEADDEGRDVMANALPPPPLPPVLEPLDTHPEDDADEAGDDEEAEEKDDDEAPFLLSGCTLKCDSMLLVGAEEVPPTGAGYGSIVRGFSLPVHNARARSSGSNLVRETTRREEYGLNQHA